MDNPAIAAQDPAELRELLHAIRSQLSREVIADFKPYKKQADFFREGSTHRERLLRAGNQCGKTYAMGAEVSYHLTGEYPEWWEGKKFPRSIVCWASGETGEMVRDNAQRVLLGQVDEMGTGMVPERCLTNNFGRASGISDLFDYIKVKHVSGGHSLLRFKFYAQGRKKWQGPPVDLVWFDEEPPEDIYDEGLARTIATGGIVALTFTPLLGMSSVVLRFLDAKHRTAARSDTNMTIHDAEHIPEKERQEKIDSFPDHEREARAKGTPVMGSGRIFPIAESRIIVAPFQCPDLWPVIGGIDFGWEHPTAAVKLVWDRDSDVVYVVQAYREKEKPVVLHAHALKAWGPLPWAWPHDGLQHDKGAGIQLAAQYRAEGLEMIEHHAKFSKESDETKNNKVSATSVEAGLSMMLDRMQTGRLKVFSHLEDWFGEFRLYHRKDGKVVKLAEDLISATRYAMMMLRYAKVMEEKKHSPRPPRNWRVA